MRHDGQVLSTTELEPARVGQLSTLACIVLTERDSGMGLGAIGAVSSMVRSGFVRELAPFEYHPHPLLQLCVSYSASGKQGTYILY